MTEIVKGNFADEMKSRYLTYALSTIMSRAVPDVRDGLKPVQRRLLYAMRMLRLDPDKGYKKCARVVGDVIGKYHPHGDQSVYDAMVRLAQDFSLRYPMVDGMGNFGSIDGDGAAAMRYTEARMTKVAIAMMRDLESGTVDFMPTYDGSDEEPMLLPAAFPNLLANGTTGIAVGMATNIPPHNVGELCRAMLTLLKAPETSTAQLMRSVKGPDFPTGGTLNEDHATIVKAYETGRGSMRVRAKYEIEKLDRGQYQIIVKEMPYQVQKSKVIEKIADLMHQKKITWLEDVRDESDENIRMVLVPKNRTIDAAALMETLFKLTDLEVRFSLNMNVILSNGTPACVSLKEALDEFLDHRRVVLVRKSTWRSGKIAERLHLLEAYKIVYLNIDEVIAIIKENDHPAPIMMERFGIDQIQADAILNMRLRRLRKLEEMEIQREYDELTAELAGLEKIIASYEEQTRILTEEIQHMEKEFGDKRRTEVLGAPEAVVVSLEDQIEKEPITMVLSQQGWVRAMKGHSSADTTYRFKEGDDELVRIPAYTTDNICFLSSDGKVYTLHGSKLPDGRGFGEPINVSIDLKPGQEIVTALVPSSQYVLMASEGGFGFLVEKDNLFSQTKNGKQIINVAKGDKAKFMVEAPYDMVGLSTCLLTNKNGRLLMFDRDQISVLGRGKGVKLMEAKEAVLADLVSFNSSVGIGLKNTIGTKDRVLGEFEDWVGKRAQVGKVPPHGFTKECYLFVPEGSDSAPTKTRSNEELVEGAMKATGDEEPKKELPSDFLKKDGEAKAEAPADDKLMDLPKSDPIPIVRGEAAKKPAEKKEEKPDTSNIDDLFDFLRKQEDD